MNSPAAVVVLGAAAVVLVCALIPPLHGIAWILAVVAALLVLAAVVAWSVSWHSLQRRLDAAAEEAARVRDELTPVAISETPQETEAEEDRRLAADVLAHLPQDAGLIRCLRVDPETRVFAADDVASLDAFLSDFDHTSFSDARVHTAFMDLFRAARAMSRWLSAETRESDGSRELTPGDARSDGWHEFSAAKDAGSRCADALLTARSGFERTALEREVL